MKRLSIIGILLVLGLSAYAWEYKSTESDTVQSVQMRLGAEFQKEWKCGVRLGIEEDLRFDLYNSDFGPAFRKSYTTLTLGYAPIEYVKIDAGYTLKLRNADSTWTEAQRKDVNEWLRHRVFFGVTGSYRVDFVKLYLRERAQLEMRTDSVNPLEKNKYDWKLRSKIGADFDIPGKPVKPYIWLELINTLNAPEYQQKDGKQFITDIRTQAGVKWRVSRLSTLNFFYRFTYNYDRDINITKKKGYIELTEVTQFGHAIGISYDLDW